MAAHSLRTMGYLLLLLATTAYSDPLSVRERNWTVQTPVGRFGVSSFTIGETNGTTAAMDEQYRSFQFYFGPLGTRVLAAHIRPTRQRDSGVAAICVAIAGVSTVWWIHRRHPRAGA